MGSQRNGPRCFLPQKHAHNAASGGQTRRSWNSFTPGQATEIDAISARIIPTDELPGAREASASLFHRSRTRHLQRDDQKTYREGLPELQAR